MIERGDYVVPYFNNRYRFDKPPLTYWFQVASFRAFGENPFAARFPSAVAAALTAVAIFAWGRRLDLNRAGFWAAIIFTLCLQTFVHAKAAVADMWLVLFMTLAHWAGYELLRDRFGGTWRSVVFSPRNLRGWWWMFYLSLAFAFLAKGPIGWMPLGTVIVMQFLRPGPHFARRFLFVRGSLLMLALVALWGVPALLRTHGEFLEVGLGRHVVGRSFGTMQGHGGSSILAALLFLPFYFLTVFVTFAPWSVKIPWLTRRLWRNRDTFDLYLIVGVAVIVVIFTVVKTKLPHYILPAFPLLALLLARHWLESGVAERTLRRWSLATAGVMLAFALSRISFDYAFLSLGGSFQKSGTVPPARDGFCRLRFRRTESSLEFPEPGSRLSLLPAFPRPRLRHFAAGSGAAIFAARRAALRRFAIGCCGSALPNVAERLSEVLNPRFRHCERTLG